MRSYIYLCAVLLAAFFTCPSAHAATDVRFLFKGKLYRVVCFNGSSSYERKINKHKRKIWVSTRKPRLKNRKTILKINKFSKKCKSTSVLIYPTPTPTQTPAIVSSALHQSVIARIENILPESELYWISNIQAGLRSRNPQVLYNTQYAFKSLLKSAVLVQRDDWISLIGRVIDSTLKDSVSGESFLINITPNSRGWGTTAGNEVILYSSQFLSLVTSYLWETLDSNSAEVYRHREVFGQILREHLQRWVYDSKPFQRRGWGCNSPEDMAHWEVVKTLKEDGFGGDGTPSYCEAILEPEYFILQIALLYLDLNKKAPELFPDIIPSENSISFIDYVSSLAEVYALAFDIGSGHTLSFNKGLWIDHPTMQFGGINSMLEDNQLLPQESRAGGSDICHESRHVFVLDYVLKSISGDNLFGVFKLKQRMSQNPTQVIANGIYSKMQYDAETSLPIRGNFLDGTDGWYNLVQSGSLIYGHAPSSFSSCLLFAGYGHAAREHMEMKDALQKMAKTFDKYLQGQSTALEKAYIQRFITNSQYVDDLSVNESLENRLKQSNLSSAALLPFYSSLENISLDD